MLTTILVDDVIVGTRLRKVDELKVQELSKSIEEIGLINAISIDEQNNLICGNHRLSAFKLLGRSEIPAMVFTEDELKKKLMEIDENLYVNSLDFISQSESIQEREIILQSLGQRTKRGNNRFTSNDDNVFSTDALAEKLGVSNRTYRQRRQISNIIPTARNVLRGTRHANNLVDLVVLSRMEDQVQEKVAELIREDNTNRSLKLFITEAKISCYTNEERTKEINRLKSKYGVPYAMQKYNRQSGILEEMIETISSMCRGVRSSHIAGREVKNYVGHSAHSFFLLDYFVRDDEPIILDNFMGNGVNVITGLFLGMKVIGFDLDPKKVDAIYKCCDDNFSGCNYEFFNEDGIALKPLEDKENYFSAIITDPPYLGANEIYTNEEEDLSTQSKEEFLLKMEECFLNYKRLIKKSSYEEKKIYPIMMKMNSSRDRNNGVISMDFLINQIAEKLELTLWDRTFNELNTATAAINVPRCYERQITIKNWETTLVWAKF
ncbi:MAG: ParB N-terminal domain-containing protein [Candidatus Neomarinimicrobiota bacterium]